MRSFLLMLVLACGVAGCATQPAQRADSPSSAPQPEPGTASTRINGQMGWYGSVGTRAR